MPLVVTSSACAPAEPPQTAARPDIAHRAAASPPAGPARPPRFDRATLDRLAVDPAALRDAIDPDRGLILIDHYDGGGERRFEHLCGAALRTRTPELSRQLAADRLDWELFELYCAAEPPPPECVFNPGEARDHGTRYVFARDQRRFVLEAIIRFETGAMNTASQDRFIANKLAVGRASRCPRE